jgi:hypothetical protein
MFKRWKKDVKKFEVRCLLKKKTGWKSGGYFETGR